MGEERRGRAPSGRPPLLVVEGGRAVSTVAEENVVVQLDVKKAFDHVVRTAGRFWQDPSLPTPLPCTSVVLARWRPSGHPARKYLELAASVAQLVQACGLPGGCNSGQGQGDGTKTYVHRAEQRSGRLGNNTVERSAKFGADAHKPPMRVSHAVAFFSSLTQQAARRAGPQQTRPGQMSLLLLRKESLATGSRDCAISLAQDEAVDPRSFDTPCKQPELREGHHDSARCSAQVGGLTPQRLGRMQDAMEKDKRRERGVRDECFSNAMDSAGWLVSSWGRELGEVLAVRGQAF